jgi:single-strand DNA-binding protein
VPGSLNKVALLGNVGKDPEIRSMQSGDEIANFSVATSESWIDKNSGEKKEKTEWHRIVCFNPGLVGVIKSYVKKGSKVYIEGALQTRKWTDQQGVERYSTEVVMQKFNGTLVLCGERAGGGDQAPAQQTQQRAEPARPDPRGNPQWDAPRGGDLDDEIPF